MALKDFFKGKVTRIIDDSTVIMNVRNVVRRNRQVYRGTEKVSVEEVKPFLLLRKGASCVKTTMEKALVGKEVTCLVHGRNEEGTIKGDIFLL